MKLTAPIHILLLGLLAALSSISLQAQTIESFTFTTNRVVPDGRADGLQELRIVPSAIGTISSLKVRLKLDGEFNGDIYAYLRHIQNGKTNFCVLLNRPGKTATQPAGYAHGGFDVTLQTDAPNGDIHSYGLQGLPSGPLTGVWAPDGRAIDPDNSLDSTPRTTSLDDFVATAGAGEWTLFLADVQMGGVSQLREWGLDIAGAAYPQLTWSIPDDVVYGTPLSSVQLNALAIYGGAEVNGSYAYTPGTDSILKAGAGQQLTVVFTPDDASSFLPVSTNVVLNVLPAPLTITGRSAIKAYGDTATFAGTEFDSSALVSGDSITSVSLSSPGAASNAAVGSYEILPSNAVGVGLTNYTIAYAKGTLDVKPMGLTITATSRSKVYGQAISFAGSEFSTSAMVNGDAVTSVTLASAGAGASAPAGDYTIVPSAALGSGLSNYTIAYASGKLIIGQASSAGSLASSANPAVPGDKVTFTFALQAVAPGAGIPTGTVNFRIDGAPAGSAALAGGIASLTLNTLSLGSHQVVAEYAGDGNFIGTTNTLSPAQIINTPPEASGLVVERYPTDGLKVALSKLLAQGKDADGDKLSLVINSKSANGIPITIDSGWAFYTPTKSDSRPDSFQFTLTDAQGGSVSAAVQINITTNVDPGQNLSISSLEDGTCLIVGSGIPDRTYRLQATDSLESPKWTDLDQGTVTADATGRFEYLDPAKSPKRFYRSVYP